MERLAESAKGGVKSRTPAQPRKVQSAPSLLKLPRQTRLKNSDLAPAATVGLSPCIILDDA